MKKASNLPFWSKKWSKPEAKIAQLSEVTLLIMERETGFEAILLNWHKSRLPVTN
jgi:hypothetical protein